MSADNIADEMADEIVARIHALGAISAASGQLTRVFLSDEHRRASHLLMEWMREAGMDAHCDAIGNVVGRYEGERPGLPCLMLGSHYDTVHDAGKWDGPFGIIAAISCVSRINRAKRRFSFAIEVVAFADEEGVRFTTTLLGSRAVTGRLDASVLDARDSNGVTMRDAMLGFGLDPEQIGQAKRSPADILAYIEVHIEQGPVLETRALPVGVVTAISGASRLSAAIDGVAGHAGTVPMPLRHDALTGAAKCILAVEAYCKAKSDLVGTVGRIQANPGAINVIPGHVEFTLDIRTPDGAARKAAVADISEEIKSICARRHLTFEIKLLHESPTAVCAPWLKNQLAEAIRGEGYRVIELPSGAGHDGMALVEITDIGMLFVRCQGGISHNPAEHVADSDVATAARVLLNFIENFHT